MGHVLDLVLGRCPGVLALPGRAPYCPGAFGGGGG